MSAPKNAAAYITGPKAHPFVVQEAPYPHPKESEVVIKNAAVAINPVDWKLQTYAFIPFPYPFIFGEDAAGEIVEVGSAVRSLSKGQRVIGHCQGLTTGDTRMNSFQNYVAIPANMVSPIPDSVAFKDAVVLPLGVSTASAGLFQKSHFGLPHSTVDAKPNGKTILIWGGSSSVGSCAIQLSKAAGSEVFAVASAANAGYCRGLGADQVFDYRGDGLETELLKSLKDKRFVGVYDAIADDQSLGTSIEVVRKINGNGTVVSVTPGTESKSTNDVNIVPVMATSIASNEVGPAIYQDYLPKALQAREFLTKPDAEVVGEGLESVQAGCDMLKAGVSARKVVVTL